MFAGLVFKIIKQFNHQTIKSLLFIGFIAAALAQLAYWLVLYRKIAIFKNNSTTSHQPAVSVIICAYNEAANLLKNLPPILNQAYKEFEVVVVNDRSTDDTSAILYDLKKQYPHLHIVTLKDFDRQQAGKKYALSQGIKASKYDTLLLTDADCMPVSDEWIASMVAHLDNDKKIVLGYGPMNKENTWVNHFSRYETTITAVQYFSYALAGLPYMGVGRNILYKKELFTKVDGFKKHEHLASGDDDLFINAVATAQNTAINLQPLSFMYSDAKKTWKKFYRQKSRHLSVGTYYKPIHKLLLGGYSLSLLTFYGLFITLLCLKISIIFVIFIFIIRNYVMWHIICRINRKLHVQDLTQLTFILEVMYATYLVVMSFGLLTSNTNRWN